MLYKLFNTFVNYFHKSLSTLRYKGKEKFISSYVQGLDPSLPTRNKYFHVATCQGNVCELLLVFRKAKLGMTINSVAMDIAEAGFNNTNLRQSTLAKEAAILYLKHTSGRVYTRREGHNIEFKTHLRQSVQCTLAKKAAILYLKHTSGRVYSVHQPRRPPYQI